MKKLIVMMLALVVAFSFTACNNDTPPVSDGPIEIIEPPTATDAMPADMRADYLALFGAITSDTKFTDVSLIESRSMSYVDGVHCMSSRVDGNVMRMEFYSNVGDFKAGDLVIMTYDEEGKETTYTYTYNGNKLSTEEMEKLMSSLSKLEADSEERTLYKYSGTAKGLVIGDVTTDMSIIIDETESSVSSSDDSSYSENSVSKLTINLNPEPYNGISSFVLYKVTGSDYGAPEFSIEVDGVAYSVEDDDYYTISNAVDKISSMSY